MTSGAPYRFTFGLWTVGNPGRDPFGEPTRPPRDPVDTVHRLADAGAWGVSLHDDDLVPFGSPLAERDRIVSSFARAVAEAGMVVSMTTVNLFTQPVFRDGGAVCARRSPSRIIRERQMSSLCSVVSTGW